MGLDADPIKTLNEAVTETEVIETVNESTIESLADAARRLDNTSSTLTDRASDHTAAQILHETRAESSAAGAERATTDAGYYADVTSMQRNEAAADNHNVLGHSAEASAQDAGAKASALDQVARVQIAVQEESTRIEMGQRQVQDRTAAVVQEEMKKLGEVEEVPEIVENLEAELAANADPSIAAPRA